MKHTMAANLKYELSITHYKIKLMNMHLFCSQITEDDYS